MEGFNIEPGQKVYRAWVSESWDSVRGFHVFFDEAVVSEARDENGGTLVKHGSHYSPLDSGSTGSQWSAWYASKSEAREQAIAYLRHRIAVLHEQCDRLKNEAEREAFAAASA